MSRLVFRSMITMASSTAQRDPITLTDDRLENSKVVKRVLDIVYNLDIGKQKTDQDMYLLRYVIDFAKKWEMEIVIKTIQREMWRRIDSKSGNPDLFRHFLIALALGDTKLATSCYKSSKIESSIPSSVRFVEPSTEDDSESDPELESDSDSDSDDSSEEENDSEEGSSSDSDEGSDSDGAPRLGQNSVTAGSSTNVPYPPLYVSDDISDSLLHRSFNTHEPGFNLNNMGYKQFLLLPPTVAWIILRAQRAQGRGGPYWNSRDQAAYMEALLNKACSLFYKLLR